MRRVVLDADAFLCLRALGLLESLVPAPAVLELTKYVESHELAAIRSVVSSLVGAGKLVVHAVGGGMSEEGRRWRKLCKEGVDKGEAEVIAWALGIDAGERPVFVSNDGGARNDAASRGVPATDVFALICAAAIVGSLGRDAARDALVVWADKKRELCRPRDYAGFEETFTRREAAVRETFDL